MLLLWFRGRLQIRKNKKRETEIYMSYLRQAVHPCLFETLCGKQTALSGMWKAYEPLQERTRYPEIQVFRVPEMQGLPKSSNTGGRT